MGILYLWKQSVWDVNLYISKWRTPKLKVIYRTLSNKQKVWGLNIDSF